MEILDIKDLSFAYPDGNRVLDNISFSVNKGEFIVLCGETGGGKSTLLRLIKRELAPKGDVSGTILFEGNPLCSLTPEGSASEIGFVMQNPEHQTVTDKVWHELAFGLENLGMTREYIRLRTAETASFFGIDKWFDKDVSQLSGGQKQILCLAAVTAMNPKLLILDEPTSQLDPVAASEFITILQKLNRELGITVIISEHRLEELIPVCTGMLVLEKGRVLAFDKPEKAITEIKDNKRLMLSMPCAARIFSLLDGRGKCPLTVNEGRKFIEDNFDNKISQPEIIPYTHEKEKALEFKDAYFRYSREAPDVLRGLSFTVYKNEIYCILGSNGSGKTTALTAAAGLNRIYSGRISIFGKDMKKLCKQPDFHKNIAYLPQDVQTVFLKNTVREELEEIDGGEIPFDISQLYDRHPYDLSGGEQQLAAIAKILKNKPRILLLDEPTKGIDAYTKHNLCDLIKSIRDTGITVVIVTHDVEFAAECGDRCGMFFRGEIISEGIPREFFSGNYFYTTAPSRITRGHYKNIATTDEAVSLCRSNGRKNKGDGDTEC